MKKIEKAWWFLTHPRYYPEFMYLIYHRFKRIGSKRDIRHEKQLAQERCKALAVKTLPALQQLTGKREIPPLESLYQNEIDEAQQKESVCPVTMGGPGDLTLLYTLAEHTQAMRVIETGVAYGWSSLALLLSLQHRPQSRLASTDLPYPGMNNEQYVGCVVPPLLKQQWTLVQLPDRQALPSLLKTMAPIDLCHYDSDKSAVGRYWAYPRLWKVLRSGGFFVSDDIGDNLAFFDFCDQVKRVPVVVETKGRYVGIIMK